MDGERMQLSNKEYMDGHRIRKDKEFTRLF